MYNKLYSLWFDAVATKTNKSSDGVLDSVKSLFKEDKVDIPETVNGHAQRTRSRCLGASTNNYCKSIIMLFTTFRHRTMFCRAKNKLKRSVRIKFDLTKSRYDWLKRANDNVKEVPSINCCLKVKFNDKNMEDIFFSSFNDLSGYCRHVDIALFVKLHLSFFSFLFCILVCDEISSTKL